MEPPTPKPRERRISNVLSVGAGDGKDGPLQNDSTNSYPIPSLVCYALADTMEAIADPAEETEETFILPQTIMERLDFDVIFGRNLPVELELGAGDGSFLVEYARLNPAHGFVGVERLLGRLRKIDRKSRRGALNNVRVLRLEASYVLDWMIPVHGLEALHVYFPDPWPKRRHWGRRLVNTQFTQLAHKALRTGGVAHLRTDDEKYFAQMEEVFGAHPLFVREATPDSLLAVKTDFEREFNARGIPTRSASWRALPTPVPVAQ